MLVLFVFFWGKNAYLSLASHRSTVGGDEPKPHGSEHHGQFAAPGQRPVPRPCFWAHRVTKLYAPPALASLVPINVYFEILSKQFLAFGPITYWLMASWEATCSELKRVAFPRTRQLPIRQKNHETQFSLARWQLCQFQGVVGGGNRGKNPTCLSLSSEGFLSARGWFTFSNPQFCPESPALCTLLSLKGKQGHTQTGLEQGQPQTLSFVDESVQVGGSLSSCIQLRKAE